MGNVINTIGIKDVYESAFEDFAIPVLESAPNTTIQNRAQVSRSLKAIAGVERVMFRGVTQLENEFGPNGEATFETDIKDSRIRFVGVWNPQSNAYGTYTQSTTTDSFMEVSFYGTGLNIMVSSAVTAVDVRPTIDGGAEGSDIFTSLISIVTGNRNYAPNIVVPVVSGLTLGLHTVKLRIASSALEFTPNGIEILNQRTDLAVYPGEGISNGRKSSLSALATSAFNAGVVGTKGARVLKYVYNDSLGSAVREVDATAKYLTNTDHTNEEVVRRINYREFGANRADDFSTLAGVVSSRAFTLDDGTTTLVGTGLNVQGDGVAITSPAGNFLTLTFVGTGLDVNVVSDGVTAMSGLHTISVDGVNIATGVTAIPNKNQVQKICSGLSYGTHTVKILVTSTAYNYIISDFIIYQPKKPSIPEGALVVADYNVMANYAAVSSSGLEATPSGTLRKMNIREFSYVDGTGGTVSFNTAIAVGAQFLSGTQIYSNRQNAYTEITFFGTGFGWRYTANSVASLGLTFSLNGSTMNTTNFPTMVSSVTGTGTFTASTGVLVPRNASTVNGNYLNITGLPLGKYTLKVNNTTIDANAQIHVDGIDIITPIHINDSALKIGSQSLKSISKYSAEKSIGSMGADLSKAKAWVTYDTSANKIMASKNVSAVIRLGTEYGVIYFDKPFKNTGYSVAGSAANGGTFVQFGTDNANVDRRYTGSCGWRVFDYNGTAGVTIISAIFFGELIDE